MVSARGIEPLSFVGISGRGVFDYNVRIYRFMDTLAENNRITMKTMECVIDVAVIKHNAPKHFKCFGAKLLYGYKYCSQPTFIISYIYENSIIRNCDTSTIEMRATG